MACASQCFFRASSSSGSYTTFPTINLSAVTTMGQPTFLTFVGDQLWKVHPVVHVDLTGKTVVVVGANVGLGFEAAKHFASMNPKRLVLTSWSQEKGQAAVQGKSGQPLEGLL